MAEWLKAIDCKSIGKLPQVRILPLPFLINFAKKTNYYRFLKSYLSLNKGRGKVKRSSEVILKHTGSFLPQLVKLLESNEKNDQDYFSVDLLASLKKSLR